METLQQIIEKLETYHFECQAGPLENCTDWQALTTRCERLAEAEVGVTTPCNTPSIATSPPSGTAY